MVIKNLAFIFTSAPYGSQYGRELLDLALAASAYDQVISLLFLEEGLFQLYQGQNPASFQIKNPSKVFAGLELYEINRVFVRESDLARFHLRESDLLATPTVLSDSDCARLISAQDHVVTA